MPSSLQVKVKHNGKLHDVTLDPSAPAAAFRTAIHNVTGVPPDRQKLMLKPGQFLKEDTDLAAASASLKQGHTFMLIGTAGPLPQAPKTQTVFAEDMTDSELALAVSRDAAANL